MKLSRFVAYFRCLRCTMCCINASGWFHRGFSIASVMNAHLLEVIELHAAAFAISWFGALFALGQPHCIRALAFAQQSAFGDGRRRTHFAFVILFAFFLPRTIAEANLARCHDLLLQPLA